MGSNARVGFRKFQESFGLKEDREFVRSNDLNFLNGWNVLNEVLRLTTDTTSARFRNSSATGMSAPP